MGVYFSEVLINYAVGNTFLLYCFIIISTFILGCLSQPYKYQNTNNIKRSYFIASFLVLWFFSAFCNSGEDRVPYEKIFNEVTFASLGDLWQEPGFELLNLFVKLFTSNPKAMLAIISTFTLLMVYSTLFYLRKNIHIGYAILSYTTLIYFQSFSLMRINLAGAMIFYATRYLIEKKFIKYFIWIILASTIHYSGIIMFLPFLAYLLLLKVKVNYGFIVKKIVLIYILIAIIVLVIMSSNILSKINILDRYASYFENIKFTGIGILQIFYFLPVCIILNFIKKQCKDQNLNCIFVSFTYSAFFIGILSYIITMIGRAYVFFLPVYLFMIPYSIVNRKRMQNIVFNKFQLNSFFCLGGVTLYLLIRFLFYMGQYAYLDGISIYQFHFFRGSI